MPALTLELVNLYIRSAKPFAQSKAERRALELATRLNSPHERVAKRKYKTGKGTLVRTIHAAAEKQPPDKIAVDSWKALILKEIYAALCLGVGRYRKEVAVFKKNANTLIGLMAGYVAAKLGIAVAVVAALVASLLRLVATMGVAVFCKKFAQGQRIT